MVSSVARVKISGTSGSVDTDRYKRRSNDSCPYLRQEGSKELVGLRNFVYKRIASRILGQTPICDAWAEWEEVVGLNFHSTLLSIKCLSIKLLSISFRASFSTFKPHQSCFNSLKVKF